MHSFPKRFTKNWGNFAAANPELAEKLHMSALALRECMTAQDPIEKVDQMRHADGYDDLRKLILAHKDALGIGEGSDREIAVWVITVGYCSMMSSERKAS